MRITSGLYTIQNLSTNEYLAPERGHPVAGAKVTVQPWAIQGAFKWIINANADSGTYYIENFVKQYYLQPGIPASRAQPPPLQLGDYPFEWLITSAPNGNGYLLVKADEADQTAEVDIGGSTAVLNDMDPNRAEKRQIWAFQSTPPS